MASTEPTLAQRLRSIADGVRRVHQKELALQVKMTIDQLEQAAATPSYSIIIVYQDKVWRDAMYDYFRAPQLGFCKVEPTADPRGLAFYW